MHKFHQGTGASHGLPHQRPLERNSKAIGIPKDHLCTSLLLRAPEKLQIVAYVDNNYAWDESDRKSNIGGITTVRGKLVHHFSKRQDTVSLSSTEAEYKATNTVNQKIMFIHVLMNKFTDEQPSCLKTALGQYFLLKTNMFPNEPSTYP